MKFITQNPPKLIKNLLLISLIFASSILYAQGEKLKNYKKGIIEISKNQKLQTYLAQTFDEQLQGLSGIEDKDFLENEAMLFFYTSDEPRRFWMPDTYFNLDIFFLDKNFTILDVERNVQSHKGRSEKIVAIARTKVVTCRHVLEVKSSSPLSKKMAQGQKLRWIFHSSHR